MSVRSCEVRASRQVDKWSSSLLNACMPASQDGRHRISSALPGSPQLDWSLSSKGRSRPLPRSVVNLVAERLAAADAITDCLPGGPYTVRDVIAASDYMLRAAVGWLDPRCGDGFTAQTEQCDESTNPTCPYGCTTSCTCAPAPVCGDGMI